MTKSRKEIEGYEDVKTRIKAAEERECLSTAIHYCTNNNQRSRVFAAMMVHLHLRKLGDGYSANYNWMLEIVSYHSSMFWF